MAKYAALLVAVLLAAFWAYEAHETAAAEHTLSSIASPLAGRQVGIECQGFWAELFDVQGRLGDVRFPDGVHPEDHAYLTRGICGTLRRFRSPGYRSRIDCLAGTDWRLATLPEAFESPCGKRVLPIAEALLTLAHESMHLRGIRSEAAAQCYGLQELPYVAVRLGATPAEGDAVAGYALALQPGMPTDYQSDECRPGGALDLHPETPEFPGELDPAPPPSYRGATTLT